MVNDLNNNNPRKLALPSTKISHQLLLSTNIKDPSDVSSSSDDPSDNQNSSHNRITSSERLAERESFTKVISKTQRNMHLSINIDTFADCQFFPNLTLSL